MSTTPPHVAVASRDTCAAIVAGLAPDARLVAVTPLTGGVSADVYRLDLELSDGRTTCLVLRAQRATHAGHPVELEFQLLEVLHQRGLPVPEPLLLDASRRLLAQPFLLMAFTTGSSTIAAAQADHCIDRMAAMLARIHELPIDGLPALPLRVDPLPEVFDYLPRGSEWDGLTAYLGDLSGTAHADQPRLLHGDFWPGNLLWRDGALTGILDWEDAAVGDPLSDVAGAGLELRYLFGRAGTERFTHAYARQLPVDPGRLALWQVYVAAAAQHFMGRWGLAPALEQHMRAQALASIREAWAALLN